MKHFNKPPVQLSPTWTFPPLSPQPEQLNYFLRSYETKKQTRNTILLISSPLPSIQASAKPERNMTAKQKQYLPSQQSWEQSPISQRPVPPSEGLQQRWVDLINIYKCLKRGCQKDGDRHFSIVPRNRTRGKGQKIDAQEIPPEQEEELL